MRRWMAVLALLVIAGCGGGDDASPAERAALRHAEWGFNQQWGRMWEELHPDHQELVPRDVFLDCADDVLGTGGVSPDSIDVVESYEERVTPPMTKKAVDSVAVTLELTTGDQQARDTMHEVEIDGSWHWYLGNPAEFEQCGAAGDV